MTWWFVAACAVTAALLQHLVVPRLPRHPAAGGEEPPRYDLLAGPRDTVAAALLAGAGAAAVAPHVPDSLLLLWWSYLAGGASLVWVDLRTTWLPRRLNAMVATTMAIGALATAGMAGEPWAPVRIAIGAGAAHLLFLLAWRLTGSMGFGDVRLAALVGAAGASGGASTWGAGLLLGTAVGALWGVAHTLVVRHRGGEAHFAYGPALWLGPVLAIPLTGW